MKLIIITLSNATIVGASILDYSVQDNIIYITTKSDTKRLGFGIKDGVMTNDENSKAAAIKAKSNIDTLLSTNGQTILKLDNCEMWN